MSAFSEGFNDAVMDKPYNNPHRLESDAYTDYDDGYCYGETLN